jgi:hypothetical protein
MQVMFFMGAFKDHNNKKNYYLTQHLTRYALHQNKELNGLI